MNPKHFLALLLVGTVAVQAHPGHGPGEISLTHADHLGAILVAVVILYCTIRALRWGARSNFSTK